MSVSKDFINKKDRVKSIKKPSKFKSLLLGLGLGAASVTAVDSTNIGHEVLSNLNNSNQTISQSVDIGSLKSQIEDKIIHFRKSSDNKHYREKKEKYEQLFTFLEKENLTQDNIPYLTRAYNNVILSMDKRISELEFEDNPESKLLAQKLKIMNELWGLVMTLNEKRGLKF